MTRLGDEGSLCTAIATILPQARWFPAKSHELAGLTILDRFTVDEPAGCELVVIEARLGTSTTGEAPRFILPIRWTSVGPVDAATEPAIAAWLVQAAVTGREARALRSMLVGVPVTMGPSLDASPQSGSLPTVRTIGGDTSNTCLRIGPSSESDDAMASGRVLKLLRQVRQGIQPEVEVGRFLAGDAFWQHSPRLLGSVEWHPADEEPAVVAVIHEEARDTRSLWDVLLERLLMKRGDHGAEDRLRSQCMATLLQLGQVTADMHAALARPDHDPAFGSEPWTAEACRRVTAEMQTHAAAVLDEIGRMASRLPPRMAERLAEVVARRDQWLARLAGMERRPWKSQRIRVHGDYHLGQVLAAEDPANDRLMIIDFEGEPQRPLAQRRCKLSAAKDVAGMIRSLDYLVRVAHREGARWLSADAHEQLTGWFLGGYSPAARGRCFWPDDPEEATELLAIHRLDKALYELAYEADNRPDWIDVPLMALLQDES